jgi:hypothetical protein
MSVPRSLAVIALAGLCASLVAISSRAELAPQYTTWQEFAAVAALQEIPQLIGVVDRIERIEFGRYLVRGGACRVEISIRREAAKSPDGRPMVGPSHVAGVKIGDKRCD